MNTWRTALYLKRHANWNAANCAPDASVVKICQRILYISCIQVQRRLSLDFVI